MLEDETSRNTHILSEDSPALFRALKLLCGKNASADATMRGLEEAYRVACEAGGKRENGFERKEGVSYNPRVARCPLILCNYSGEKSWITIAGCMLGCARTALPPLDDKNLMSAKGLAEESRAWLLGEVTSLQNNDALAIALALSLDEIRHLHQRSLTDQDWLTAFISRCETLLNVTEEKLCGEKYGRLLTIYRKSLGRYSTST